MASEKRLDLINKWDVVNKLIRLENSYNFYKDVWDAQTLYRRICELEIGIGKTPTVDAVEVVRCQNCVHAEPLDRNCEINTCHYMHCKLYRGEETKNVWHKYKKYYKDYSLVERDGYCDAGAKMDGGNEDG